MGKKKKSRGSDTPGSLNPRAIRALVLLGILALIGGVVAFFVLRSRDRSSILSAHGPSLKTYLAIGQTGASEEAYLPGKVVTVDAVVKEIDPVFLDLPPELIARNPDEVGAVVLLEWQVKDTGMVVYRKDNPGVKAPLYEKVCVITVVERATGRVTARTQVSSKTNPEKYKPEDIHEGRPTGQVVDYLKGLRRK